MLSRSKKSTSIVTLAALLLAVGVPALALPTTPVDPHVTVGDFLLSYARSMHLNLPPDAGPETALAALRASGTLPALELSLTDTLTHGSVVKIGRASGLKITSATPDKALDRAEADLFLDTFSRYIVPATSQDRIGASDNPPGEPASNANTNKGKKKGRPFQSPSEPEP